MALLNLTEYKHPQKLYELQYNELIGIDGHKKDLISALTLMLDQQRIKNWLSEHHSGKLSIANQLLSGSPLIILSGDVGCGKTALAQSVATPLAVEMKRDLFVFETPSNIRGSGLVGEISNRITEAFEQAKRKLGSDKTGILIIDEADDIATSRSQNQAHHEDRAGLNVLIKQIDTITKEKVNLAVILITNRVDALDPAVRRRTSLHLEFNRPQGEELKEVLQFIFTDIECSGQKFDDLLKYISEQSVPYSFSDLIQRVAKGSVQKAIESNQPFSVELFDEVLKKTGPSPIIE